MYVTTEEGDAHPLPLCNFLQLQYKPVALSLCRRQKIDTFRDDHRGRTLWCFAVLTRTKRVSKELTSKVENAYQ